MMDILERRLAQHTREMGGNERSARLEMIAHIGDVLAHARRNEEWPLRRTIGEAMLARLWEPLVPWMVAIGAEHGIAIRPEEFVPPYSGFDGPARKRNRVRRRQRG
jgi:hypothetical protein